jgi:hypothetical protein
VAEWLSLPTLYAELPPILSVRNIGSPELGEKADSLRTLLERWTCPEPHGHKKAQPSAPPHGGPAMQVGNSGVTEGPPSVS